MKTIIKVENLAKKYKIGVKKPETLVESFVSFFKKRSKENDFWALKDINIEIKEG